MLEKITSPADLKALPQSELPGLADEIRQTIIETVAANGGHLASNLGTVELTIALHRVFDSPEEKIFFDVGHQSYTHKLLTGRRENFHSLRCGGGISGFPNPAESAHDPFPAGHAGSALPAAHGAAAAEPDSPGRIIAVIGDGSIGCGPNLEAMNHSAGLPGRERLILILNDNRMSISTNVGTLSNQLNRVISGTVYNRVRKGFKSSLHKLPRFSRFIASTLSGIKSLFLPKVKFFENLGFRYLGPVNGHDLKQLIPTLKRIKNIPGPLVLHVATGKGYGCSFAEADPTRYHGIAGCEAETGRMESASPGFSRSMGKALLQAGENDPRIVAVSAAMLEGTGLAPFAERFPDRTFDTGIAEEYAVTFAASLARSGKRPVCAIYDTFLQRALDQVYHDCVLAGVPLIFAIDRAGAVEDGPTHHGIYNCGFLRSLPQLTLCAPAGCAEVAAYLQMALKMDTPVAIRYPRGGGGIPSGRSELPPEPGKAVIVRETDGAQAVIWSFGAELATALQTAELLAASAIRVNVIDARFLKPFDKNMAHRFAALPQFTIEDHVLSGGLYSALCEAVSPLSGAAVTGFGWDAEKIVPHGKISELREKAGLLPQQIADRISAVLAADSAHRV